MEFPIYSPETLPLSIQEGVSTSPDSSGSLFEVHDFAIAQRLRSNVAEELTDLLRIALWAYCADQLSKRNRHWRRSLGVEVPVRNPEFWKNHQNEIVELLEFLTDDMWTLRFTLAPPAVSRHETKPFLPIRCDSRSIVALYSGGLDSFAGLVNELSANPNVPFVLVASSTNSRQVNLQRAQIDGLRKQSGRDLTLIQVRSRLLKEALRNVKRENSQRARGFLHLTLGLVTALSAGCNRLYLYENGVGAINLPYDGSHVGARATRAVHPGTLRRMAQLVRQITKAPFEITNPFLFWTKGQMLANASLQHLGSLIEKTFSCDGFPVRQHGKSQCGTCTSCLLRRLSLEAAGLSSHDPGHAYCTDCSSWTVLPTKQLSLSRQKMEDQARIITDALNQPDPWNAMQQEFPRLGDAFDELTYFSGMSEEQVKDWLLALYRTYVSEWESFSGRPRPLRDLAEAA